MPELTPPGRGALRPGAMTAAMRAVQPATSGETWARVAIVRRRAIVAQRWVRPGESLTWGRSERADVVIASAPHDCAPLVVAEGTAHALVLDGALAGRLAIRGAMVQLADEARRGARRVVLEPSARAHVLLGDAEVLIEMAPRPPAPRRPPLPASLGRALGVDPRFTAIAVASLVAHAVFVTALSEHDWPAVSLEERLMRDAHVVFVEPEPPPETPLETERDEAAPSDAPREDQAPTEVADATEAPTSAPRRGRPSAPSAEQVAAMRAELAADVDLQIGALMPEGGSLDDLMRQGAAPASQAEVIGLVRAEEHAALGPRAGDVPAMRDGAHGLEALDACEGCALDVRRTREVSEGGGGAPQHERPITVQVPPREIEDDAPRGDFDHDALARALRGRMGAVRACYERALRDHPTLAGRLELELSVERVGTVSGVRVRAGSIGDAAFHGCVERSVSSLRLREGPEGGPVEVSFPIVLAPQG